MAKSPERIFLQWETEGHPEWPGEGVTWSEDRINEDDVEYVRVSKSSGEQLPTKGCDHIGHEGKDDNGKPYCTWCDATLPEKDNA